MLGQAFSSLLSSLVIVAAKKNGRGIPEAMFSIFACNVSMGVCMTATKKRKSIAQDLAYAFFVAISGDVIRVDESMCALELDRFIASGLAKETITKYCKFFARVDAKVAKQSCIRINDAFVAYDARTLLIHMYSMVTGDGAFKKDKGAALTEGFRVH